MRTLLSELVELVETDKLPIQIGRVFSLNEIVSAHRLMEADAAQGKIVVRV